VGFFLLVVDGIVSYLCLDGCWMLLCTSLGFDFFFFVSYVLMVLDIVLGNGLVGGIDRVSCLV